MTRLLIVLVCVLSSYALADSGPQLQNLEVTRIFNDGGESYYIEFNNGSMPGCFSNRGGRLLPSNPRFSETYSMVLTIMATGGIKGGVNYENFRDDDTWSDCEITGFDLRP
ncbi:hypothetical protein [Saccharospirillum sp. MSK14-1]|uniref:hypothetical protein n=1 Tax=Saccharospirillum sp. MSK14-1 TaxID=1897632 RepID=UPI0011B28F61|nr:hypothetical protein [Saccharospirillum sp. MSK14-1]